jgi:hypothetical protein
MALITSATTRSGRPTSSSASADASPAGVCRSRFTSSGAFTSSARSALWFCRRSGSREVSRASPGAGAAPRRSAARDTSVIVGRAASTGGTPPCSSPGTRHRSGAYCDGLQRLQELDGAVPGHPVEQQHQQLAVRVLLQEARRRSESSAISMGITRSPGGRPHSTAGASRANSTSSRSRWASAAPPPTGSPRRGCPAALPRAMRRARSAKPPWRTKSSARSVSTTMSLSVAEKATSRARVAKASRRAARPCAPARRFPAGRRRSRASCGGRARRARGSPRGTGLVAGRRGGGIEGLGERELAALERDAQVVAPRRAQQRSRRARGGSRRPRRGVGGARRVVLALGGEEVREVGPELRAAAAPPARCRRGASRSSPSRAESMPSTKSCAPSESRAPSSTKASAPATGPCRRARAASPRVRRGRGRLTQPRLEPRVEDPGAARRTARGLSGAASRVNRRRSVTSRSFSSPKTLRARSHARHATSRVTSPPGGTGRRKLRLVAGGRRPAGGTARPRATICACENALRRRRARAMVLTGRRPRGRRGPPGGDRAPSRGAPPRADRRAVGERRAELDLAACASDVEGHSGPCACAR